MKVSNIAILVGLTIAFGACTAPDETEINHRVVVSGKLHNAEIPLVSIDYLGLDAAIDTLGENGDFFMAFELDRASLFELRNSNQVFEFYAEPGDSIFIEMDMGSPYQAFKAGGDRTAENTYLLHKDSIKVGLGVNRYTQFMSAAPEDYVKVRDSLMTILKLHFNHFSDKDHFSPKFSPLEEAYFSFEPLLMDKLYPNYHGYTTGNTVAPEEFLSEEAAEKLANPPTNLPELLSVSPYRSLLEYTIQENAGKMMETDTTGTPDVVDYFKNSWDISTTMIEDSSIQQYFQFNVVKEFLDFMGPANVAELHERFTNSNPPQRYVKMMDEAFAKWEEIMPGKEVPDFAFTNVEGEEVRLSDLRGSLVYVDIWATWCGPCIAEHPHWEALKVDYHDAPISFLTVSIDNTPEPWRKMLAAKGMEGHQWHASGAWQSAFARHFLVTSIPRFLLIDEDGKIIDPSAVRPSGGIAKTLDAHLEKSAKTAEQS